jgi:hypothetical protein
MGRDVGVSGRDLRVGPDHAHRIKEELLKSHNNMKDEGNADTIGYVP